MARPSGPKTRCSQTWTEAKYTNFIKNILRQGSRKWAPIHQAMKKANTSRGLYLCNGCNKKVPLTTKVGPKRHKNIFVDHIEPIVNPDKGFTTWDDFIEGLFCELENLQVLCKSCHDIKTKEENDRAKLRRQQN